MKLLGCLALTLVCSVTTHPALGQQGTSNSRYQELMKEWQDALNSKDQARIQRTAEKLKAEQATIKKAQNEERQKASQDPKVRQFQQGMQKTSDNLKAKGETLEFKLARAAERGDLAAVKSLHSQGADLNKQAFGSELPLMTAARRGDISMATYLLDNGANMRHNHGLATSDALVVAVNTPRDNSAMIKFLLGRGADANGSSESLGSAMMKKADSQNADRDNHANIKASQFKGNTPLLTAIEKGNHAHARILLQAGARTDIFGMGMSPLMRAASRLDTQMVRILLDSGAEPNLKGPHNDTALKIAERQRATGEKASRKREVVDMLRARGAR